MFNPMTNQNSTTNSQTIQCGDFQAVVNRQPITNSSNKDYKKIISDKLVKRIIQYRENRIDSLRNRKEEIVDSVRQDLHSQDINIDCTEELLMSEYFDYILHLFESDELDNRYNLDTLTYFENISICPHCHSAVFAYDNSVVCINKCLKFNLQEGSISDEFTLDNFLDLYKSWYNNHQYCGGKVELFQIDALETILFVCSKCNYNT
jgi:hypothetical protein